MKTKNKKQFNKLSVCFAVLAFTFTINVNAFQSNNGNGNTDGSYTGETGNNDDIPGNCGHGPNQHAGNACGGGSPSVPLDGGLGFLLLGAAAFGVKKLRDNKNTNN